MVVAGPSVAGAVIGLVLVLRPDPADHGLRGLGVAFILGLGTLGIVVGILAVMIGAGAAVGGVGVLTLAGIVALIACVSIGLRGGQALERVSRGGAPPNQATAWALKAVLPFSGRFGDTTRNGPVGSSPNSISAAAPGLSVSTTTFEIRRWRPASSRRPTPGLLKPWM